MNGLNSQVAVALAVKIVLLCLLFSTVGNWAYAAEFPTEDYVLAVSMDNDLFVPKRASDHDFTGGMAVTLSSTGEAAKWAPLDTLLAGIDSLSSPSGTSRRRPLGYSIEAGLYGFTPHDVSATAIAPTDRPYASLVYLSSSRLYQLPAANRALSSSLSIGVLGSDMFEHLQTQIHRAVDTAQPQGWHNQIADGGELTARYQLALHNFWSTNSASSRAKTTNFSSIGYITEAGVALSSRHGLISSPDNRFNPELIAYGERVNETATTPHQGPEHYFWAGMSVKARLYNAFLQGQLRNSRHTLAFSDLRPLILEAWVGYTFSFADNYKVSYVIRAQTSEIRTGHGDREHFWGGIVLSQSQ